MRARNRVVARRHLDKRLNSGMNHDFVRPPRGWVKAIREALGMTTAQLARRIGVVQSRAVAIEKAEVAGSMTLDSLARAARALDCDLVYALVPRKPLQEMVEERATALAMQSVKATRHTMALEDQSVDEDDERELVKKLAKQFAEEAGSSLWQSP